MIRKPVGGKIVQVTENTELVTAENCDTVGWTHFQLKGFYIRNEDTKDVYVKINGSEEMLLKPEEMFNLTDITDVQSCIVVTPSTVRWGGVR